MAKTPKKSTVNGAPKLTPMLVQYLDIKSQNPGSLLLFRMGDFYETFFEDAQTLSKIAGVTLTSRDSKSNNPIPLAGVPYHSIDTYLTRLLKAGITVAICEQIEDPAEAKGIVKRAVVEVISPGTATAPELVDSATGHFCLAWVPGKGSPDGWALLDASTGEFRCGLEHTTLESLCLRHAVKEVIARESTDPATVRGWQAALPSVVINLVNDAWFHPAFARQTLLDHFETANLTAFGLEDTDRTIAATAAGSVLRYLNSLILKKPAQVTSLRFSSRADRLVLDEETLRNLEIFRTFRGEKGDGTLIHHIDGTLTAMGRRLLEERLAEALTNLEELNVWHSGIASALEDRLWREDLRTILKIVSDMERLAARAASGRIGPLGLRQMGTSLAALHELQRKAPTNSHENHPINQWLSQMDDFKELGQILLDRIVDEPPVNTRKPGYIAEGVDSELDQCRTITRDSKSFLAGLQQKERERTGISTLKVGFNRVFGYYFEVTKKHLDKVPENYEQKQTLVNACRFHTPELKSAETTILEAEEKAEKLETAIFQELIQFIGERLPSIHKACRIIAQVDLMLGYAEIAEKNQFCRPLCDDSLELNIKQGRHPVVEQLLENDFIANDTLANGKDHQVIVLTGPNMGGKSTYLRQVALITLLAQAGGFVPAESARIGIADRIFTRVGASDNLARGESTFYMEMSETANILHQMSRRSLVILDEIGRGTSTYDGLSLAWAITEFLNNPQGPRPRCIFATHYHQLTELENEMPGLVNLRLEVKEWEGKIIFLHSVGPGRSDKSYGIHVARLAGLPETVLERAQTILSSLSVVDQRDLPAIKTSGRESEFESKAPDAGQLSLFRESERDALDALNDLDLEKISPMDAFMWLAKIKKQMEN
ncbi:MAG: DNA mismatch repair protein MutS [bacterium]|nr:DNA mismatch repair protein MutS [bacterium]